MNKLPAGARFDQKLADHAVNFIEVLKHTKGEWHGQPFKLLPWQKTIITDIFGTVKENGYRQYNTAYVEIPKKQGKSELAAAVALYLLSGDAEWGGEVYGCAADRAQASIVFDVACQMVGQCPALRQALKIIPSQKRIVYPKLNSFYQVLSSESYSKHGINVHGVIFDELHAQPTRDLFDVMTHGSGDARKQPLYFLITTAGTDRHSICYEQHKKAEDILRGKRHDPTFYPVIYGAGDNDDWSSEKVWEKANPSLGVTVDISKLKAAYQSAKENPAEENLFRQLRLNQWVKQSVRWMPMDKWNKCAFTADAEDLYGRPCYGGLDLASTTDITAFVLVFPPRQRDVASGSGAQDLDSKYIVIPYFWLPEETIALRVRRDRVPYDVWQKKDLVRVTEGNVTHYEELETFIGLLKDKFDIREIAYDRWNAAQIVQRLGDMGITMVPFGQGFASMSSPTKELMKLVLEERIAHGGNEPLAWMADNVTVRTDPAGNIKPDKEKSTEKIDGIVALIMALDRALKNDGGETDPYAHRGIIVL
jgi:phage terminase large subunit-like protein